MGNCENSYCCWYCKLGLPCVTNVHNRTPDVMTQGRTPGSPPDIRRVHDYWPANASGRSYDHHHFHVICKEFSVADSDAHIHQYEDDGNCTILQLVALRYVFPNDVQEFDAVQRTQRVRCLMQGYQNHTFAAHTLQLNTRIDDLVQSIERSNSHLKDGASLGTVCLYSSSNILAREEPTIFRLAKTLLLTENCGHQGPTFRSEWDGRELSSASSPMKV